MDGSTASLQATHVVATLHDEELVEVVTMVSVPKEDSREVVVRTCLPFNCKQSVVATSYTPGKPHAKRCQSARGPEGPYHRAAFPSSPKHPNRIPTASSPTGAPRHRTHLNSRGSICHNVEHQRQGRNSNCEASARGQLASNGH